MICECGHSDLDHVNAVCKGVVDHGKGIMCDCDAFEAIAEEHGSLSSAHQDIVHIAPAKTAISEMRMVRVTLDSLTPDPDNAAEHPDDNLEAIDASLEEFGQIDPLIVQASTRKIIAGNARHARMLAKGWTHANVIEVDIDDERASALGLVHNRTGRLARWNAAKVLELVGNLEAFRPELAKVVGFESDLLAKLTNIAAKEEREALEAAGKTGSEEPKEVSFTTGGKKPQTPELAKAIADELRWMAATINAMPEPLSKPALRSALEGRMREHRMRK